MKSPIKIYFTTINEALLGLFLISFWSKHTFPGHRLQKYSEQKCTDIHSTKRFPNPSGQTKSSFTLEISILALVQQNKITNQNHRIVTVRYHSTLVTHVKSFWKKSMSKQKQGSGFVSSWPCHSILLLFLTLCEPRIEKACAWLKVNAPKTFTQNGLLLDSAIF